MKKWFVAAMAVCLSAMMLIGCGGSPEASGTGDQTQGVDASLTTVKEKGELIIGLDDSFPPMGFRDEAGELTGFDVEMAQEVCKRLGVTAVLQPIDWSAKEMELNSKTVDVLWNGYTITDERKEKVLFSDPYMKNTQVIVVLKDSEIQTLEDLKGKKVAVQDGSSAQDALKNQADIYSEIEQIDFKENVTAFLDVDNTQVDALAIDEVVANYYLAQKPDTYRVLEETLAPEEYGVGFRMEDVALRDEVQRIMDEMVADGTAKTLSEKWFGKDVTLQ